MSGCWVSWRAEIRTRPDIADIRPYLAQAIAALRQHHDIEDARCEYDPHRHRVRFVLCVRWTISKVIAKCEASAALHDRLPTAGFDTGRAGPTWQTPFAWLRFDWWPTSINWL
jgi:hypothetical protein